MKAIMPGHLDPEAPRFPFWQETAPNGDDFRYYVRQPRTGRQVVLDLHQCGFRPGSLYTTMVIKQAPCP